MDYPGTPPRHVALYEIESLPVHDWEPRVRYSHRWLPAARRRMSCPPTPDQRPCIGFVGQDLVNSDTTLGLAGGGSDPFRVEQLRNSLTAHALVGETEHAPDHMHRG